MQADPEYILRFRSDDAKRVLSSLAATASGSALQVLQGVVALVITASKTLQMSSASARGVVGRCSPTACCAARQSASQVADRFARQAGGGGSKAQAQNLLAQARAAAKAAKAVGTTAQKAASEDAPGDGTAVAAPSGPDPRLQAPKRQPVTVRANCSRLIPEMRWW